MAKPLSNGIDTSDQAAKFVEPFIKGQGRKVLEHLANQEGGATSEEMQMALNIKGDSVRPLLKRFEENGIVYRPGVKRETASGCLAYVYLACADVIDRLKLPCD